MAAKKAKPSKGFSAAERAAMKERARELKAEARASKDKAAGEQALLATIAAMPAADRALGERLHAIVTASGPALWPKLWYGMPAYANPPHSRGRWQGRLLLPGRIEVQDEVCDVRLLRLRKA